MFKWLKNYFTNLNKDYIVTKTNDEIGTEVRYNGHSYKLHINDQVKFNAYLKTLHTEFFENLRNNNEETS